MTITRIILLSVCGLLIAYDVFAMWRWGVQATISRAILGWTGNYGVGILLAVGILVGHLFFQQDTRDDGKK